METIVGTLSDTQQLTEYREQNIQQLTNIFTGRLPSLTRIAGRVVGNAADAEDAVQDAFLSAYTHLDQFRGQAKMSTWLTTIVINSARMKVRARPRQVHIPLELENREQDPSSEMLSDPRPSPEELCRSWELTERLAQASLQLSPALRGTFQLNAMDGLSTRETAQALGIPEGTVKARVARARRKLKQLLQTEVSCCRDNDREASDRCDCGELSTEIDTSIGAKNESIPILVEFVQERL
jgi:RNA polymerase sigma-70 factor, ECF subfamily